MWRTDCSAITKEYINLLYTYKINKRFRNVDVVASPVVWHLREWLVGPQRFYFADI